MAGSWQPLNNQPYFCASTMLLLTDGTVMVQQTNGRQWWRLTPDANGSYVNGSWSRLADAAQPRLYYASAVLADGSVFVSGGEYNGGTDSVDIATTELYDPVADSWMTIAGPPDWTAVGDAPCCVLPDGRVMVGDINNPQTATFDPVASTWTVIAGKNDANSEETWTLLPDGSVLVVDCSQADQSERFVPATGTWKSAGTVPVALVDPDGSKEIGPALLLPNGKVLAIGATGHTALYTPPAKSSGAGSWVAGPDFPADAGNGRLLIAKDAPACLLPNGNVLCTVGPDTATFAGYGAPTSFFEFDGTNLNRVPDPPNNGSAAFNGRLLLLPTGQALYASSGPDIYAYTPDGMPDPAWRPVITGCPANVNPGDTFALEGRQLTGLSQAVSYGDDVSAATNYPVVRITTSAGTVRYCKTSGHSDRSVAAGSRVQSTSVNVPASVELGMATLEVVANGIPSDSFAINIGSSSAAPRARPAAAPAPAGRGVLGDIGGAIKSVLDGIGSILHDGLGYVRCGLLFACNWTYSLQSKSYDERKMECTQTADQGYSACSQTADKGYSACSQTADQGYSQCCTWAPCSWFCNAWVWISNVVCVAWTWISDVVCVAWTWISNVVCVAWAWIITRKEVISLIRTLTCN